MHIAAVIVVLFGLGISRADLSALRRSSPTPEYQERSNRLAVSSRGGARIVEQNLLTQTSSVRTTLGERKTPTAIMVTPTGLVPVTNTLAIGGPVIQPDIVARTGVITYVVQAGDIVGTIAQKFGLSEDSIGWANSKLEDNPDLLMIGDELLIPPVDGVLHTVQKGDTLEAIAQKYKVEIGDIVAFEPNGIKNAHILIEGQQLVVPGGKKPYIPRAVVGVWSEAVPAGAAKGSGSFIWPAQGYLTQYFWDLHRALDIAFWEGAPIIAADGGYVAEAGRSSDAWGYGNYILIDHGNGYQTLYAHLSALYVRAGQSVSRGQEIGAMGNTGRSTGTHLHFEIRQWGVQLNPLNLLP